MNKENPENFDEGMTQVYKSGKEITPLSKRARTGTSIIGVAFPYENVKNSLKNLKEELNDNFNNPSGEINCSCMMA